MNNNKLDASPINNFVLPFVLDFQEQNILTGYEHEPIIPFHLPSTICEDGSVSQNLDIDPDSRDVELNGLCHQVRHLS